MPDTASQPLRLGTRGSLLAQAQSRAVAESLGQLHGNVRLELVICKTTGDRVADRPLAELGGKGLFTKELEEALLRNEIDLAVHSFKDVPVTLPLVDISDLVIAAVPPREDVRDVLVSMKAASLLDLPAGATVGTGSLRRRCQILNLRPDLNVQPMRGNIDTRIKHLREGKFDAIVLAMAGVKRGGLFDPYVMHPIPIEQILPAAGQGALAIQCRRNDLRVQQLLSPLNDEISNKCVEVERELVRALNGDCHSPIAALATIHQDTIDVQCAAGSRSGEPIVVKGRVTGSIGNPDNAIQQVLSQLKNAGVERLLADN